MPTHQCDRCDGRLFQNAYQLQEHVRKSQKHFLCGLDACKDLDFATKDELKQHWEESSIEHNICPDCEITFQGKRASDELETHKQASHLYCKKCNGRKFVNKAARIDHYIKSATHDYCTICNELFDQPEDLIQHKIISYKHHYCPLCNIEFSTAYALQQHKDTSSKHPHCAKCDKNFISHEAMRAHMIGKRGHNFCDLCDTDFESKNLLLDHIHSTHPKQHTENSKASQLPTELDMVATSSSNSTATEWPDKSSSRASSSKTSAEGQRASKSSSACLVHMPQKPVDRWAAARKSELRYAPIATAAVTATIASVVSAAATAATVVANSRVSKSTASLPNRPMRSEEAPATKEAKKIVQTDVRPDQDTSNRLAVSSPAVVSSPAAPPGFRVSRRVAKAIGFARRSGNLYPVPPRQLHGSTAVGQKSMAPHPASAGGLRANVGSPAPVGLPTPMRLPTPMALPDPVGHAFAAQQPIPSLRPVSFDHPLLKSVCQKCGFLHQNTESCRTSCVQCGAAEHNKHAANCADMVLLMAGAQSIASENGIHHPFAADMILSQVLTAGQVGASDPIAHRCAVCHRDFRNKAALDEHTMSHAHFWCGHPACLFTFNCQYVYVLHMEFANAHPWCSTCGSAFQSYHQRVDHAMFCPSRSEVTIALHNTPDFMMPAAHLIPAEFVPEEQLQAYIAHFGGPGAEVFGLVVANVTTNEAASELFVLRHKQKIIHFRTWGSSTRIVVFSTIDDRNAAFRSLPFSLTEQARGGRILVTIYDPSKPIQQLLPLRLSNGVLVDDAVNSPGEREMPPGWRQSPGSLTRGESCRQPADAGASSSTVQNQDNGVSRPMLHTHHGSRNGQTALPQSACPGSSASQSRAMLSCSGCGTRHALLSQLVEHWQDGGCISTKDELNMIVAQEDSKHAFTVASLADYITGKQTRRMAATEADHDTLNEIYNCPYCSQAYGRMAKLTEHLESPLHDIKPYKCPVEACDQRFAKLSMLLDHVEHTASCSDAVAAGLGDAGLLKNFMAVITPGPEEDRHDSYTAYGLDLMEMN